MSKRELDALIAGNIEDLEAAISHVKQTIDPYINREAWAVLKQALHNADYYFEEGDDLNDAWFAPRSWLDEDEDSDPWFRLNARDGSGLETWLACYAAPPSERDAIGIQWHTQNLYVRDYKAILNVHSEDLRYIEQAGFRRDGNDIYLPISFDSAKLAEGFIEGDLSEALAPIATAVEALKTAQFAFQRIRDAIVKKSTSQTTL